MTTATYQVRHRTAYQYGEQIPLSHNEARVQPRALPWQRVTHERLSFSPEPDDIRERTDFFGNRVAYYSVQHPHHESVTLSEFTIAIDSSQRPRPGTSAAEWPAWAARLAAGGDPDLMPTRPWIYASPRVPLLPPLGAYARDVFADTTGLIDGCGRLMSRIHDEFAFDPDSTLVDTPLADAFAHRRGVCQDFTHIMLGALRAIGLPARYVSGYIETSPAPGQPKLEGADATHAWLSVFDPDAGWIDFDPTNNLLPAHQHITLGWGRDFTDIIPVKGVVTGGDRHTLDVAVDVTAIR